MVGFAGISMSPTPAKTHEQAFRGNHNGINESNDYYSFRLFSFGGVSNLLQRAHSRPRYYAPEE